MRAAVFSFLVLLAAALAMAAGSELGGRLRADRRATVGHGGTNS
jgi:hypothetical protein